MCSGSDANPEGFYMAKGRGQCVPLTEPAPECLTLPERNLLYFSTRLNNLYY